MIRGNIRQINRYTALSDAFGKIVDELTAIDWSQREYGRYDLMGGEAYVNYSRNVLNDQPGAYETHESYIDLQYVLEGEEIIYWAERARMEPTTEYDAGRDCRFYTADGDAMRLGPGDWVLLFPEDGHAACVKLGCEEDVKLVVKIPVNRF